MYRTLIIVSFALCALAGPAEGKSSDARRWLAGDHHVHSIYSAQYRPDPAHPDALPAPIVGGDSSHTILQNARMARRFGLHWMVSTDHGGPRHAILNHQRAWPDVVEARRIVPDLTLFYGAEFDVPGGEHASLILPIGAQERDMLRDIESRFGKREAFPADPARNTKSRMIEALGYMAGLPDAPVVIGNHPSRTATGLGRWGLHAPAEYHAWHEAAPHVAIGMEGAPGHQAASPKAGLDAAHGSRGLYGGYPTMGGFDQMVATLGGGWDALLGQGLHWTITATSDSHGHWQAGGADFWPGEYAKTWVFAAPTGADIMDGLRSGRIFAATGDLIHALDFSAARIGATGQAAAMGDTLAVPGGEDIIVTIRFRPADKANAHGDVPKVDHIDLIAGHFSAPAGDHNATAKVVRRFTAQEWTREGQYLVVEHRIGAHDMPRYLRVRGTSTGEAEPLPDRIGENPWSDLWFYSNPIYIDAE